MLATLPFTLPCNTNVAFGFAEGRLGSQGRGEGEDIFNLDLCIIQIDIKLHFSNVFLKRLQGRIFNFSRSS